MTLITLHLNEPDIKLYKLDRCYQCKACSAGCPFANVMDYLPHQIVRKTQLGLIDEILKSRSIWYCASCETCYTRCPQGVDIPGLIDFLKILAWRKGKETKQTGHLLFNRIFMDEIRRWGRQYEMSFLLRFKFTMRDFWGDLKLGIRLILKRKLSFLPPANSSIGEIRNIFRRTGWNN